MNKNNFFKILQNKINRYDKAVGNPFDKPRLIIVWVEEKDNKKTGE